MKPDCKIFNIHTSKFAKKSQTTMPTFAIMSQELLLSQLQTGQIATIVKFTTEEIFLKLMEMGCLPGEKIEVVQKALFNDPMSISVAGYLLSLRTDEARQIVVKTNI